MSFSHIDDRGKAVMVDVSSKAETLRIAKAEGFVLVKKETMELILDNRLAKGNVVETARIAGIMAAKKTSGLIPLCHPLNIEKVSVEITADTENSRMLISSTVSLNGKTGVEMEALTAVSVAALTIYDMIKAVDREAVISGISLVEKSGGKSGKYVRKG